MVSGDYFPERGDLVWIDFNPQKGHEHSGRRPAVVISTRKYNEKVGLALFCPITSKKKGYPFEVELPKGLPLSGVVLSDQIKSLDWRARNVEHVCALPPDVFGAILWKAKLLLA